MAILALFGVFLFLLFAGTPVGVAMLAASLSNILVFGMPQVIAAERMTGAINSFPLLAIPFFILAGVIMNRGGITQRLVDVSRAFIGHRRGGTAQVNVLASIFFSGISGSASADAAAIGSMLIPAMKREGYPPGFAVGITAASATIGPIIPPSIVLIIYGSMTNMSIGALFLAGVIPGLMIGLSLMLIVAVMARRQGFPSQRRMPWRDRLVATVVALPALVAPAIILGGILGGLYTATEAGVIACLYGLFVGVFVYREFRLRDLPAILVDAAEQVAIPVFILASAAVFGWLLTVHGFGRIVISFMNMLDLGPLGVLFFLIVALLLVGLVVEGLAALVIFVPIVMPLVPAFGLDPLQVALIMVVTVLIGTVTPPVGLQLYIAATIGRVSITQVVVWPFVFAMVGVVVIMALVPELVTWLPRRFGF
mgnify:CR=1 FL=1